MKEIRSKIAWLGLLAAVLVVGFDAEPAWSQHVILNIGYS